VISVPLGQAYFSDFGNFVFFREESLPSGHFDYDSAPPDGILVTLTLKSDGDGFLTVFILHYIKS